MISFGQLAKLGHASFVTRDLERLADYYADVIGLRALERGPDAAHLTSGIDHHTVELHRGEQDGIAHLAFELAAGYGLDDAARQLADHAVASEIKSDAEPGIDKLLELADPEGNTIQLYEPTGAQVPGPDGRGIVPTKLGHICLRAADVPTLTDWYEGVLGFRWSDWIGDFFVFVRCGADHHSLNLLRGEASGNVLHHIAYELRDFAHVQPACDLLFQHGFPLVWGPGRHGPGHNIYTYHRDPDGNLVELFTQLDVMNEALGCFEPRPWHEDRPQRPKRWTPDPLAPNRWGIPPPDGFM